MPLPPLPLPRPTIPLGPSGLPLPLELAKRAAALDDKIASTVAGEAVLLATALNAKLGGNPPPGSPAAQSIAAVLAQGPMHPGRALEAARTGPDRGLAWLGGGLEVFSHPSNYIPGGQIDDIFRAARLMREARAAEQTARLGLPELKALGTQDAPGRLARWTRPEQSAMIDAARGRWIAESAKYDTRLGLVNGNAPKGMLLPGVGKNGGKGLGPLMPDLTGEAAKYDTRIGLKLGDVPKKQLPLIAGKRQFGPDLPKGAISARPGQAPLAAATALPGGTPSTALDLVPAAKPVEQIATSAQLPLAPAANIGDKASAPLTQALDPSQRAMMQTFEQVLRDGSEREVLDVEEWLRDAMGVRQDTIDLVKRRAMAALDDERDAATLQMIEQSPYAAAFGYFNPDGSLKKVNPITGEKLIVREGGRITQGRSEVWNLEGSGYDEVAANLLDNFRGDHNQNYGESAEEFWTNAQDAFKQYKALKGGKRPPSAAAYSGLRIPGNLGSRLATGAAGGASGYLAGLFAPQVDPTTHEPYSQEDLAKLRLGLAGAGFAAGFAGGGRGVGRAAGGAEREAVGRWLLDGAGETVNAGLSPAQRASLLQIAPEFDAQLRSFARDPAKFDPVRFRSEALANATADDLSNFFAENLPNIQAGNLSRDEVLAAIFPTRLSIRRGPVGERGVEKVTSAYPELADQLGAARIAGGPDSGKVRPEDIAAILLRQSDEGRAIAAAIKAGDHGALARALERFKAVWPGSIMGHEGATLHDAANKLGPLTDFINQRASHGAQPGTLAEELIAGGPDVPRVAGIAQGKVPFALWQIGAGQGRPTFDSKVIAALKEGATPATYRALLEELYPWARQDMGKAHQLFWDATQGAQTPHTGLRGLQEAVRGGETLGAGFDLRGALGKVPGMAPGSTYRKLADRAWEDGNVGQAAAVARNATTGLWPGLRGIVQTWRRDMVQHPRNILQDEGYGRMVIRALQSGAAEYLAPLRADLVDRLKLTGWDAEPALIRDPLAAIGKEGYVPRLGDSMADAERKLANELSAKQSAVASGILSAANPSAIAQNALGLGLGIGKGYQAARRKAVFETVNGFQQASFRRAVFLDELRRNLDTLTARFRAEYGDALPASGLFSPDQVRAALGNEAANVWQGYTDAAVRLAEGRAKFLLGDYSRKVAGERLAGGAIPFMSWAVRAYPVALAMAAEHPGVALAVYRWYTMDDHDPARKPYERGTLPVASGNPLMGALASILLGGASGEARLDPIGTFTPVGAELFTAPADTGYDQTPYQRAAEGLGRVGFGFNPLVQSLAYVLGWDNKPSSAVSRTQGIENGLGLLPLNPRLPAVGKLALDKARDVVSGGNASTYDPVARRFAELVMQTRGKPLSDPSNADLLEAVGDEDNPLWQQARREVLLSGLAKNVFSLTSPTGATTATDQAVAARRAVAGLPFRPADVRAAEAETPLLADVMANANRGYTLAHPAADTYAVASERSAAYAALDRWEEANRGLTRWPGLYAVAKAREQERLGLKPKGYAKQVEQNAR